MIRIILKNPNVLKFVVYHTVSHIWTLCFHISFLTFLTSLYVFASLYLSPSDLSSDSDKKLLTWESSRGRLFLDLQCRTCLILNANVVVRTGGVDLVTRYSLYNTLCGCQKERMSTKSYRVISPNFTK